MTANAAASLAAMIGVLLIPGTIIAIIVFRLLRSRSGEDRRAVLQPIMRSAAVQSEAYGWTPPDVRTAVEDSAQTAPDERTPTDPPTERAT